MDWRKDRAYEWARWMESWELSFKFPEKETELSPEPEALTADSMIINSPRWPTTASPFDTPGALG
jgi:hypothetical protein